MLGELMTLDTLGTFSGLVLATTVVSQFLKGTLDRVLRLPTRWWVLLIAVALQVANRAVSGGGVSLAGTWIDLLNGFAIAAASMGTWQVANRNLGWK